MSRASNAASALRRLGRSLWDVRPGEHEKTLLLTASLFFTLAAHTLVEPVANALFLHAWGASSLPWVYLLSVVPAALVASLYTHFARAGRVERVTVAMLATFVVCLLLFRWALFVSLPGTKLVLYLWSNVFGLLATSQMWLLANNLFDPREAKRLYGLLGLGAIAGGIAGGALAARLAGLVGSEDLLLVAAFVLLITMAVTLTLARRERGSFTARAGEARKEAIVNGAGEEGIWPAIRRSRHLRLLVMLGSATMFTATLVDYIFKTVAADTYHSKDDLTAFFGAFQAALSTVSLVLQVVLVGAWAPLLRTLGIARVMLVPPIVILMGSVGLFLAPRLLTAALVKAADLSLRYSLHRSTFELLFLPLPLGLLRRTKATIDMFGDRFARGAAGVFLLVLLGLGVTHPAVLAVTLGLSALLVIAVVRELGREYVTSLRSSIAGRAIDLDRVNVPTVDAAAIDVLRKALHEESPRQVLYALELLATAPRTSLAPDLAPLLRRPEPEIRLAAFELLVRIAGLFEQTEVERLVSDDDARVRTAAVLYLCRRGEADTVERFLDAPDPRLRAAAVAALPSLGEAGLRAFTRERLQPLLAEAGPHRTEVRRTIALVLRERLDPRFDDLLVALLRDPDPDTALAAIGAAGALKDPALVPPLVEALGEPRLREAVSRALAAYGDPLLPAIENALADPRTRHAVRMALPRVLRAVATPAAVAVLVRNVPQADLELRLSLLKALVSLREAEPGLALDRLEVERHLLSEARSHYEGLEQLRETERRTPTASRLLLGKALRENLDASLERVFRLLGLRYPPRDIFHIHLKIKNARAARRASALELLDNLLEPHLKELVLPMVDAPSMDSAIESGRQALKLAPPFDGSLAEILRARDPWIRAVAIHLVGEERLVEHRAACEQAAAEQDPLIRAEALRALALLPPALLPKEA